MITDVCDAVVTELNGHVFSPTFTAVRAYVPEHSLPELATLRVLVLPSGWTRDNASRDDIQNALTIQIGIQKKLTDEDDADPLVQLAIDIVEYMQDRELGMYPEARFISAACDPIYDLATIDTHNVFISIIELTYWI